MAINATAQALNATLNSTLNATNAASSAPGNGSLLNGSLLNTTLAKASAAAAIAQSFIPLVLLRTWDLIAAPFRHSEMLWIILPLFFTLIVMELYADRHGNDEFGFAAALANSLVLIFVAIDLIKQSFPDATPWSVLKEVMLAVFGAGTLPIPTQTLILIIFLGAYGLFVTLINYFHLLPSKLAYIISHHASINYLAYFAIAVVYAGSTDNPIPFDLATLVAGALLFVILLLLVFGIKKFIGRFIIGQNSGKRGIWS